MNTDFSKVFYFFFEQHWKSQGSLTNVQGCLQSFLSIFFLENVLDFGVNSCPSFPMEDFIKFGVLLENLFDLCRCWQCTVLLKSFLNSFAVILIPLLSPATWSCGRVKDRETDSRAKKVWLTPPKTCVHNDFMKAALKFTSQLVDKKIHKKFQKKPLCTNLTRNVNKNILHYLYEALKVKVKILFFTGEFFVLKKYCSKLKKNHN